MNIIESPNGEIYLITDKSNVKLISYPISLDYQQTLSEHYYLV